MTYEQKKMEPLPPPKGLDELDLIIWHEIPDRWGDCSGRRLQNKFIRARRRDELIKQMQNGDGTGAAQV